MPREAAQAAVACDDAIARVDIAGDDITRDDITWLEPRDDRKLRPTRRRSNPGRRAPFAAIALPVIAAGMIAGLGPSAPTASSKAQAAYGDGLSAADYQPWAHVLRQALAPSAQAMLPLPASVDQQPLLAHRHEPDPNEALRFGPVEVPRTIVETVFRAAARTRVDPVYLMALADKESSFAPQVKASTSSAEGMFQFIDKTWLAAVKQFGGEHGLADEAAKIRIVDDKPIVDEAERTRILAIRRDPYLSAVLAAEMLKRDRSDVSERLGRDLSKPEYYLCHFLGYEQAARFMQLMAEKPEDSAAEAFPAAARANVNIFYARAKKKRRALSLAEVHAKLGEMIHRRLDRYGNVTQLLSRRDRDG